MFLLAIDMFIAEFQPLEPLSCAAASLGGPRQTSSELLAFSWRASSLGQSSPHLSLWVDDWWWLTSC